MNSVAPVVGAVLAAGAQSVVLRDGQSGGAQNMGNEPSWAVELAVRAGELENFRGLMREVVDATRGESGPLSYECFVREDGTIVDIYERYVDSAAAGTRLRTFGDTFAG